jgi:hypothetical protein
MKQINCGTVSSGTMLASDLIPSFCYELRNQRPCRRAHLALLREIEARMESEGYYDSEDAGFDLESLFDALGDYAPSWFYFGAHAGDGSDYGFWLSEGFEYDFEGLKVSDLSDIPPAYVGEVAVINDHGNISLYSRGRNHRLYELWSLV